jgi:hypothetical protein
VLQTAPSLSPEDVPTAAHYVRESTKSYSKGEEFDQRIEDAVAEYIRLDKLHPHIAGERNSQHVGYRTVAAMFGVGAGALRYNVKRAKKGKKRRNKRDRNVLIAVEELALVLWVLLLARLRFPATKRLILSKAQQIAKTVAGRSFKAGLPSDQWWADFKFRHPQVKLRKVRSIDKARSDAVTRDVLNSFYADLRWLVSEYKFTPDRIFNMDETGLESLGGRRMVAVGADGDSGAVLHTSSSHITLIARVNANGTIRLPPTFLFTGKEGRVPRNDLLPGAPEGWTYMQTGTLLM